MEHVCCNLCGAEDSVVRYPSTVRQAGGGDWRAFRCTYSGYGRHHTIVECQQCGLVYTDPRPDGHDIVKTYQAVEDPLYLEEREGRVLTFEHHLKPLERLTGPPNGRPLLDVGCYTGIFVEIAARHGLGGMGSGALPVGGGARARTRPPRGAGDAGYGGPAGGAL